MLGTIRIHLDENCENRLAVGLRQQGIDVTTTNEAGLVEASDEKQLKFALTERHVLISHDSDMVRLHQAGLSHCGIIYSRQGRRSNRQLLDGITLIFDCYSQEEMFNKLEYI